MAEAANVRVAIETEGIRAVNRSIKRLGVESKDLGQAMKRVGELVVPAIRELIPSRTGRLAASVKPSASQTRVVIRAGSKKKVPYAGVQNYGWPGHNIEGKQFMEHGLEDKRDPVLEAIEREINDLIDQAFDN